MTESNIATAASETGSPGIPITHFDFRAKVFAVPGARFARDGSTGQARFYVTLGSNEGSMDIDRLRASFGIAVNSHDDELVSIALKGLSYVADIRPGDKIPSEILNGSASWSVLPQHREIAARRLRVQLMSWVSGREIVIVDDDKMGMLLEQIEDKARLRDAFQAAAAALGRARDDYEFVLEQLEVLARELCFVEALRDKFRKVQNIADGLNKLRPHYNGNARARDELQRVQMLIAQALALYGKKFEEVDAQTGEIIAALKSVDRQVEFIRMTRDEIFGLLRDWDTLIARWGEAQVKRCRPTDMLIGDTYRLLASRFASSKSLLRAA